MADFSRRSALGMLAAAGWGFQPGSELRAQDAVLPIKSAAAKSGRIFGSAFDTYAVTDGGYGALLRRHAAILTTDWSLKFGPLRPKGPEANFSGVDKLVQFGNRAGIPVRGHNLIWNEWNPPWLVALSRQERAYWLDRHIEEVVGRYTGMMHSWDVVNEPLWPDHGNPDGLRGGPWYDALGFDHIVRAFKLTARLDPRAKLVLNEAHAENDHKYGRGVRAHFIPLLRKMLDAGVKLDAVGLECHLRPPSAWAMADFLALIDKISALGPEVYITELDVNDGFFMEAPDRDAIVASTYKTFLDQVLQHKAVTTVITWQLSDKYSFYQDKWKGAARPLPFDRNFQVKPAYDAIVGAFNRAA